MDELDFKHPHVSVPFDEQRSIISDSKLDYWHQKRQRLCECRDLLVVMRDGAKFLNEKCDSYLHLKDSCWNVTQFNYLAILS